MLEIKTKRNGGESRKQGGEGNSGEGERDAASDRCAIRRVFIISSTDRLHQLREEEE